MRFSANKDMQLLSEFDREKSEDRAVGDHGVHN